MESYILDDFTWSFSRIETFDRCPKCFELQYVKCIKGTEGAYGQYGSLAHMCLEKYAKGELAEYELSGEYINNFDTYITEYFPYNKYVDLREKYYNAGLEYFNSFDGFGERKLLGIENEYFFDIDKYNFTGKIDLECDNEIIDHKTKGEQHLKRLTKKHNKEDYIEMADGRYIHYENFIQLYIYCIPYKEKHGYYPKYLSLNMLRVNDWYTIEFDESFFEKSKQWLVDKIKEIYNTTDFKKGDDVGSYWCSNTCGQRLNCCYSDRYLG